MFEADHIDRRQTEFNTQAVFFQDPLQGSDTVDMPCGGAAQRTVLVKVSAVAMWRESRVFMAGNLRQFFAIAATSAGTL